MISGVARIWHRGDYTAVPEKHKAERATVILRRAQKKILYVKRGYGLQCFDAVGWVSGRASGPSKSD